MYHYKFILVLFTISLLIACQADSTSNAIGQLEKTVASNSSPESTQELITAYKNSLKDGPNAVTANAITVGKIASLQLKNKQVAEAVQTLKDGIGKYYAAPATAENVWSLANIYQQQLGDVTTAKTICKIYVEQFPTGKHIANAKKIIDKDNLSLTEHIDAIGGKMYNEKTHKLDIKVAGSFIQVCELYALLKPEDSQSPNYLHKAGETARAIRAFPQAINIYDRIYAKYPSFEKAPQALFLKAFTYDNDLKDFDKAKALYTEFLKKFPNDDFADDTEFLLKNLGKNDEEIIQDFNKKPSPKTQKPSSTTQKIDSKTQKIKSD